MATTFASQALSAAGFSGIRARLADGVGFFQDGPYRYAVFDSDVYRAEVVTRTAAITFSETIAALPSAFKVVINGNYFSGKLLYARASTGALDPADVNSVGDVRQGGSVVLPDDGTGKDYFFFGRDNSPTPIYTVGEGNPPNFVTDGMGGLGPIILPNPVTTKAMKFGVGNVYASDPVKNSKPATPADFIDLVQRNNGTYASINARAAGGDGYCAIAFVPTDKLLLAIIKPHNTKGDLDALRDGLLAIGATHACFTDGSNSACLAVDRAMEPGLEPNFIKDRLIETGFGFFLFKPPPPAKIRVTFDRLTVKDDGFTFGEGEWTVNATVNGASATLMTKRGVNTDDVVTLANPVEVTVASGAELKIRVTGIDEAGTDDDLGNVARTFSATSSPRFGTGSHTVLSTNEHYEITFTIELLP
jgi:hypothetical protein